MLRELLMAGAAMAAGSPSVAASAQETPGAADQPAAPAQQPGGPTPVADSATAAPEARNDTGEIVVTGIRRNREDVLSGTSVLSGVALERGIRPTIGETLAHQPGVSATSFGPNASRPILRGFQGERIRILTDGIGSLDISNTSVDHAVAINPLTAIRIEVLRGPSALLFGSAAVGGVVNVIDARIPRRVPPDDAHLEGILTYGSAANERTANAALDLPLSNSVVLHADVNYSRTDDMRVGGFLLSPSARTQALGSAGPDIQALAMLRGRLPNSAARTSDLALGAAWIHGDNNVGFSINRLDSLYGIPIRFSLDPAIEAEASRIDLRQTRMDGRAEIDTGSGFIDSLRFRGGYSDYRHSELDENGAAGTTFFNKGKEARLEAVQSTRQGWGGGFGIQYFSRDLRSVGAEKSLPRNRTSQVGLFALQTYSKGLLRAEAGARFEHQSVDADADPAIGNPDLRRSFNALSGSVGASLGSRAVRLGLNLSHSERAPSAEELYVNGPHPGTQAFEVGDPGLSREKSNGVELTLKGSGDGYSYGASAYHIRFSDYIYEAATGAVRDDLPLFEIRQANARYRGFEIEGSVRLARIGRVAINLDGLADYVKASIQTAGPAPRMPPFRLLGGIEAQSDVVNARLEVERVSGQDRLATFETATRGYAMVNASVSLTPFRAHREFSLTVSANNLLDVDARRHASFLKDVAPLGGRDVRIVARASF